MILVKYLLIVSFEISHSYNFVCRLLGDASVFCSDFRFRVSSFRTLELQNFSVEQCRIAIAISVSGTNRFPCCFSKLMTPKLVELELFSIRLVPRSIRLERCNLVFSKVCHYPIAHSIMSLNVLI